jgi:hypothetical protein
MENFRSRKAKQKGWAKTWVQQILGSKMIRSKHPLKQVLAPDFVSMLMQEFQPQVLKTPKEQHFHAITNLISRARLK